MAKGWLVALICLAVVGAALICVGAGLIPYFRGRESSEVDQNVVLKNNSEAYKAWLSPPAPVYIDFYFFHILNPDEMVKGLKPKVTQRGPYVYRELQEKIDVEFLRNDTELFYKEDKWYVFEAEMSNGTEEDNITSLDIAVLTVADRIRYIPRWLQSIAKHIVHALKGSLVTEKSVKQLLWGYSPDILVRLRNELPQPLKRLLPNITAGFYVGATGNGTDGGSMEISTGLENVTSIGLIRSWKDSKTLSFWSTPYCNMINGTDGTLFHPFVKKEKLYLFSTDMCRSAYIEYERDATVSTSQIPVYQYEIPPSLLSNSSDNWGFCTPSARFCLKPGVLNVSNCRDNVPIVISQPHFLDADEDYLNAIEGLHPNESLRTVIDIEPTTGIVLKAAKKLQINFYIRHNLESLALIMNLSRDFVFPLFWVNEHGVISDADAAKFKQKVLEPMFMAKVLLYALIGCGLLFVLLTVVLGVVCAVKHKRSGESSETAGEADDEPLLIDA